MPDHRSRRRGPAIGLEIGTRSIRAAEVKSSGGVPVLRHYAQVDLPEGAVTDGEVVDPEAVGRALRELWSAGHFSHHRVVVGVSSQRVIVRQADLPAMNDSEVRSALQFEAENLIPIPVDEAILDFTTIDALVATADPSAPGVTRILLAAAQRTMVAGHLAALAAGGLRPVAVYPASLAMLQGIPSPHPEHEGHDAGPVALTEAVIGVGETTTTLAIREAGTPRFVRVLTIGTDAMSATHATAGAPGAGIDRAPTQLAALLAATMTETRPVMDGPTRTLIDDVCGSLDFYLANHDADRVDRVVVAGGGELVDAFVTGLMARLGQTVERADPLSTVTVAKRDLDAGQLAASAPFMVTPIGLALWGGSPGRPITLLPSEAQQAARERRQMVLAGAAVIVVAALLVLVWWSRAGQVTTAKEATARTNVRVAVLKTHLAVLSRGSSLKKQVDNGQQLFSAAVAGEVDWTRLLGQVSAVMPPDVHLNTVTFTDTSSAASAATASGSITVSGVAANGPASVAAWLRALGTLPALSGAWVQNLTEAPGAAGASVKPATFNSSASLTNAAKSARSVPKAPTP